MTYDEIRKELESQMTDSQEENDKILRAAAEKYTFDGNADGVRAATEMLVERMSEERKNEVYRITHVDGMRLDELHNKIVKLINEDNAVDAKPLAERLYKKITVEFKEGETAKFVSLRNPFEDNLCQLLFKQEKTLNRAPFDFCVYITTYAYILVETGSPLDAIPILRKAMEYNPVDVGAKFELAEVYKLIKNKKKLIEITRETLKVASSPLAIARCYANMGYCLTDSGDYDDAAAFYTASVMMAPNPAIPQEMAHLADLKGSPLRTYDHEHIVSTLKKYDIEFGPNKDVIEISAALAAHYLAEKNIPDALRAMKITYNLTRDEQIKQLILKYEPTAQMAVPRESRPDIKQTVNNNPEQ